MNPDDQDRRRQVMQLALGLRQRLIAYLLALTKDADRAEDLFQSVYLVICEKWQQYVPDTNFAAWAFQIARYQFLASVAPARHRLIAVEAETLEEAMRAAESTRPLESDSRRCAALRECLRCMQTRARLAFQKRYAESCSARAIASDMGLSLNALYVLLSRTRRSLQACIERRLRAEEGL